MLNILSKRTGKKSREKAILAILAIIPYQQTIHHNVMTNLHTHMLAYSHACIMTHLQNDTLA